MACQQLIDMARQLRNTDKLWIVPMYGALPAAEQVTLLHFSSKKKLTQIESDNFLKRFLMIFFVSWISLIQCYP